MAEPALKFGPEWLRALSQGTALPTAPPSPGLPKYKLAEHRYGREEMLALLPKDVRMPPDLQQFDGLVKDVIQPPMALVPLAEDEQRMWSRSVNSDAVLRLMGRGVVGSGPVVGTGVSRGGGRVGSVDRGRGRGRGSYFQRSLEDGGGEVGQSVGFSRQRSYERSNSLTERGSGWDERDRRYDKPFARDDDVVGPQRKEGPRTSDWRSSARDRDLNGEDDGGWRGGGSRPDKWGRGSWRGERDERSDRHQDYVPAVSSERSKGYRSRGHYSGGGFWEEDFEVGGNLPEWSTEDNKDAESVGTFDASGAFLETKLNDERAKMEKKRLEAKHNSEEPKQLVNSSRQGIHDRNSPVDTSSSSLSKSGSGATNVNKLESSSTSSSQQNSKASSPDKPTPQPTTAKQRPQQQQQQASFVAPQPPPPLENTEPKKAEEVVIATVTATKVVDSSSSKLSDAAVVTTVTENRLQQIVQKVTQVNPVERFKVDIPSPIDKKEEVNFEHLKKAAESLVDTWTAEEEEKIEVARSTSPSLPLWYYRDPHGLIQGPFSDVEMGEWYRTGYFDMSLLVRRGENGRFCPLGELAEQLGRVPFMPNVPQPPPLPVNPVPSSNSALNGLLNPSSSTPLVHPTELPATSQDPHLRLLHQQLLRQQFIQQQLFHQQQLLLRQQLLGLQKQPDGYPSPNPATTLSAQQQQQQFLMQRILAQQQQQVPRPVLENGDTTDVLRQFAMLSGIQMKEPASSLWNLPSAPVAPRTEVSAGPGRWPMSVWDIDSGPVTSVPGQMTSSEVSLHEQQQQQQQRHQQLLLEEQQKKRLLGEEEMQRKQQQQQHQEAEERRRQKEKEEQRERERIRLEELRRHEEEVRLEEELRRQEELRKQKELEERRVKEEEMRRKQQEEEFLRREEVRLREEREREALRKKQQQEEMKKKKLLELAEKEMLRLEEQKRLEELRWKREEEKRLKAEEEKAKKKQEEERLEKEQQQKLKKQQQEALKKLNEKRKAKEQGEVWGGQKKSNADSKSSSLSLAEIQKIEEQKEHEERVKRQLLQQQQQMAMLKEQRAAQQAKMNLAWVNRPLSNSVPVKSLLEIQQEEAEKLAQKQLKEQHAKKQLQKQRQQAIPNLPLTALNAWSNTTHLLRSASQNDGIGTGFWDEAVNACNTQQLQQVAKVSKSKSNSNKTMATSNHQENKTPNKAETAASNGQLPKQRSNKNKKDDNVMKLLDVHKRSNDEFTQWCVQTLSRMQSAVDVPTFVAFLKDVDSPYEVSDYVRSYLGDSKETRDFGKQFLEKRSHYRSQARKCEEENMWGPAPAVNPSLSKASGFVADSEGFKTSGGCKKKKKNKMQKVDNTILGFTVHAANDRVNVGDIERLEDM